MKIKNIIMLICVPAMLFSCADFLDENPNRAGNDPIEDLEQLDNMMNEMAYQTKGSTWGPGATINFVNAIASDDYELHPEIQQKIGAQDVGLISILDREYLTYQFSNSYEMGKLFNSIYHLNTVLVNIDDVDGNDETLRKKIKAEALSYRAYYHFNLIVNYSLHPALNGGNSLGMGYRTDISFDSEGISSRNTVSYTMGKIYEDISEAQVLFEEIGADDFEVEYNWRLNKVSLMAIKARIDLYNGNYSEALAAANYVLSKYNYLEDLNNDANPGDPYYIYTSQHSYTPKDGSVEQILDVHYTEMNKQVELQMNNPEMIVPVIISSPFGGNFPMSESLYASFDIKSDLRLVKFFTNNAYLKNAGASNFTVDEISALSAEKSHNFQGVSNSTSSISLLQGPNVPEMMLIKAECLARGEDGITKDEAAAQSILQSLRAKRFELTSDANNISGNLQDVLTERRRERPYVIRWYDIKRLNALDNAGIVLSKKYFTDRNNSNSGISVYSIQPNANAFALPIPDEELSLLNGWEQNPE
ncbi:RagB/SusD family nutrient uptake outer membrane protein [Marinifilum fragile]|uniref:RagB/SusD family nutrient uptake outer membrane protein n=1 Tax=Marinifilum fragile TaxID=570161 RepID=UPI002AA726D7|nr:RagB/SusD family nutrient uptake outer membrane protein [Marinifilum fragile]